MSQPGWDECLLGNGILGYAGLSNERIPGVEGDMEVEVEVQEEDLQMSLYLHSLTYCDDLVPEKQRGTAGKRQERRK